MAQDVKQAVIDFLNSKKELPSDSNGDVLKYTYLDSGHIDSMGIVEMVMKFEDQFGVHFEPAHMQSQEFRTIGGLIDIIERLSGENKNV